VIVRPMIRSCLPTGCTRACQITPAQAQKNPGSILGRLGRVAVGRASVHSMYLDVESGTRGCVDLSDRFGTFEGASRVRDLDLLVDREVERAAALGFDLGLVMGSFEVRATPSAAPPQPRRANHLAGRDPLGHLGRTQAGIATLRSRTKASHFCAKKQSSTARHPDVVTEWFSSMRTGSRHRT
jgi:hypothetical protein